MADLRINNISPELRIQLKVAAAKAGKTVRDLVLTLLEKAMEARGSK